MCVRNSRCSQLRSAGLQVARLEMWMPAPAISVLSVAPAGLLVGDEAGGEAVDVGAAAAAGVRPSCDSVCTPAPTWP